MRKGSFYIIPLVRQSASGLDAQGAPILHSAALRRGPNFPKIPPCAPGRIYGTIYAFTVKALMKTRKTPDRISEIVAEMHSITVFAEGSISSSSNSYTVKDGTRRKAKPHWKFQSLGARGERKYKNVPESLVPRVRKLIANGRRYRKLEREYARLVTEESLAALKKTAGEG